MSSKSIPITGTIITYNEERNIQACIESIQPLVDEIIVVDSYSSDRTTAICEKLPVKFIQHPFAGWIEQKNFAVAQARFDRILSLDADERISATLRHSILAVKQNWNADGYFFNRLNNYCGVWLKHAWYPDKKLRLWDRRYGRFGGTNPHDAVLLQRGKAVKLRGDLLHYAYESLENHYVQISKYAVIIAHAKHAKGQRATFPVHVILNPIFKFFRRYVLGMGFLDGYYGLMFSVLSAHLNFMKYARLWEMNRQERCACNPS